MFCFSSNEIMGDTDVTLRRFLA